jgi:CBS domain-containing protein
MDEFSVSKEARVSEFDEAYEDADKEEIRSGVFSEPLSKVPRRPLLAVPASSSLRETIDAMNERGIGCALVIRDGKLVGIFTERDVLRRVVCSGLDLDRITVEQLMTPDPDTLMETATVAYALRKMSVEGYRHIPLVSSDDKPVGVVAVTDIVAWMVDLFPASVLNLPPRPENPSAVDGG